MKQRPKLKFLRDETEEDILSSVANLTDIMLVFAVGLMLAILTYYHLSELLSSQEITIIKNPNQPDMEIIKKTGDKVEKYKITTEQISGEGKKIGTIYQLKTGEIIYVSES